VTPPERAQLAKDAASCPRVTGPRASAGRASGGRQRTALARAPRSIRDLILDDTLSAVDAGDRKIFQPSATARVFRGTVAVVASRVSTVREADRIVVLDGAA
jgi:ABC-type multidrug transport system fused ATPase/permease subunit